MLWIDVLQVVTGNFYSMVARYSSNICMLYETISHACCQLLLWCKAAFRFQSGERECQIILSIIWCSIFWANGISTGKRHVRMYLSVIIASVCKQISFMRTFKATPPQTVNTYLHIQKLHVNPYDVRDNAL
jgi:hypothetical protein